MRRGFTVVEMSVVIVLIGLLLALTLPTVSRWMDRLATERAVLELATFYNRARFAAIFRSTRVRLEFSADSLRAVYEGLTDSVFLQ
ncbi:MAG: prepilin-type N-terminal cleavage/methylation domain-containing protein, partial [Gemmatimonadales bacterium]